MYSSSDLPIVSLSLILKFVGIERLLFLKTTPVTVGFFFSGTSAYDMLAYYQEPSKPTFIWLFYFKFKQKKCKYLG